MAEKQQWPPKRTPGLTILGVLGLPFLILIAAAGAATAQQQERGSSRYPVSIVVENDLFTGGDSGYTSGVAISFANSWQNTSQQKRGIDPLLPFLNTLTFLKDNEDFVGRRTGAVGQLMMTPEELEVEELIEDDIPYAGLLFARLNYEYRTGGQSERFGLLLGVVGPSARAEETQKFVHKLTNSAEPRGWDNQLDDEPAVNIDFEHMWKLYEIGSHGVEGYRYDISGYAGASLGNVLSAVDAGLVMRWGLNLPLLPCSVYKRGVGYVPDICSEPDSTWSFFLMGGLEVNYVAYSVFLDGNMCDDDSPSVNRIPEQAAFFGGLGLAYQRFRINLFLLRGTQKYREQDGSSHYGSLTMGWVF